MNLPTPKEILANPFQYLYLKRKRKFKLDNTEIVYGEGEQTHYTVIFSPNVLENQYPIYDFEFRYRGMKPVSTDYKHEYFSLNDPETQKHITEDIAKSIVESLNGFLEFEDWKLEEIH